MVDIEAKSRGFIVQQSLGPKTRRVSVRLMAKEDTSLVSREGSNEKK